MNHKPVYQGGLMRCCLETLDEYEGPEMVGTEIVCKYCQNEMIVTPRGWEWVNATSESKRISAMKGKKS